MSVVGCCRNMAASVEVDMQIMDIKALPAVTRSG